MQMNWELYLKQNINNLNYYPSLGVVVAILSIHIILIHEFNVYSTYQMECLAILISRACADS